MSHFRAESHLTTGLPRLISIDLLMAVVSRAIIELFFLYTSIVPNTYQRCTLVKYYSQLFSDLHINEHYEKIEVKNAKLQCFIYDNVYLFTLTEFKSRPKAFELKIHHWGSLLFLTGFCFNCLSSTYVVCMGHMGAYLIISPVTVYHYLMIRYGNW